MSEKIGPMSAENAQAKKLEDIPEAVFEVFNGQIVRNLSSGGRRAVVYQDVVVKLLTEEHNLDRSDIYSRGWLDVEPLYRDAGWEVQYDKPMGYAGETYRAHFVFNKPKQ